MTSFPKVFSAAARMFAAFGFTALLSVAAMGGGGEAVQLRPDELVWVSSTTLHGLKTAVLSGNPALPEPYVQRIVIPPNSKLKPHRHPNSARQVTVLSGTIYFGFGESFDAAKLVALPAGSFFTEPANAAHFAMTKDDGVVLELHAVGPDGTVYVETPVAPASETKTSQEIEELLRCVSAMDQSRFVRNGSLYTGKEAADHLRRKWEMQKAQIKTADDFITLCGTKSSMSGQAYLIQMADGKTVETAAYLKEKLSELRSREPQR